MTFPRGAPSNPFAVQRHGPDNVHYHFTNEGQRAELLRLALGAPVLELIGPHGAGKSTLLATIHRELARQGRRVRRIRFRRSEAIPIAPLLAALAVADHLLLDSAEVLAPCTLRLLVALCRLRRLRIVMTLHQPAGLGHPRQVQPTPEDFTALVMGLTTPAQRALLNTDPVAVLQRHRGNAREALMELYDHWENLHRGSP